MGCGDGLSRMARVGGQDRKAGPIEIGDRRRRGDRTVGPQLRSEVIDVAVEKRDFRLFEAVERIAALG